MGTVIIKLNELDSTVRNINKTRKALDRYSDEIFDSVISRTRNLTGTDSKGYVASASGLAKKKMRQLETQREELRKCAANITRFSEFAEKKDTRYAQKVKADIMNSFGKRNVFKVFADSIYEAYVVISNEFSNSSPLFKELKRVTEITISDTSDFVQKTKNYFKYGNGKYLWNIAKSVGKVFVAAAALLTLVGLTIGTGGAALPAILVIAKIGIVAGAAATVLNVGDMMATVNSNVTAYEESKKGKVSYARYHGNVEGVNDKIKKTDYGSVDKNKFMGRVGVIYESTTKASEVIRDVATLIVGASALGQVKTLSAGKEPGVVKYDFSPKNIKQNLKYEYYKKAYKSGIGWKNGIEGEQIAVKGSQAFKLKVIGEYQEKIVGLTKSQYRLLNVSEGVSNVDNLIEGYEVLTGKTENSDAMKRKKSFIDIFTTVTLADEFFDGEKKIFDIEYGVHELKGVFSGGN